MSDIYVESVYLSGGSIYVKDLEGNIYDLTKMGCGCSTPRANVIATLLRGVDGKDGKDGKTQDLSEYYKKGEVDSKLKQKQDAISNLDTIRANAEKGATAVQPSSLATVATSGSYTDLKNKPSIPAEVTEQKVREWGFGTYTKPSDGIPANDLNESVKESLRKANSALQRVPDEYITESELKSKGYATSEEVTGGLSNKVDKVEGKGLSSNDYTKEEMAQVERVRNGSVVVDNTLSEFDETSNKPVSGEGINKAIGTSYNNALAGFSGFQMINKDDFTIIGEYINLKGGISNNSNAARTEFLPLNGRKIVCAEANINTSAGLVIAFFDANKNFIEGVAVEVEGDGRILHGIAPREACYVVFSHYNLNTRYMASIFASEESLSQRVNSTVYTYNAPLTAQSTSFIETSNGQEGNYAGTSASGKSTWFVDIKWFSTLRFNGEGGNASVASVAFYDENFTYLPNLTISAEDATAGIIDFTEEKYNGVRYVRLSHYRYPVSSIDYSKFVAEFRTNVNIAQRLNTLDGGQGLNVLVFGDSITDCANITVTDGVTTSYTLREPSVVKNLASGKQQRWDRWPVILRNAMACKEVRNYALSGATYKDVDGATTRKSLSYQVNLALADVDNAGGAFNQEHFKPDVIVFALGTNDGIANDTADSAFAKIVYNNNAADVEATLNSLDRTKFCEAAMWAFLTIKYAFPYAQCFCYLPIQRNSNNNPIGNVHSELIKVANRFGVLVIDGGYGSGIVREISNFTLGDGLHPNWRGQNLMARQIISAIKNNYVPLDSSFMNKEQPTE